MKFSIQLLLVVLLWSGVFFLPQGEAQINKEEFQTLREELKQELRKELREEIEKELQIRQELREHLIIPCRNLLKPHLLPYMGEQAEKFFRELEDSTLKALLKKYPEDEDERLALYFVVRRKCEKAFDSEE